LRDYVVAYKDNTHFGNGQAKYIYGAYFCREMIEWVLFVVLQP